MKEPIHVVITGADGHVAYLLLYAIANGDVFGADQPLILHLLDSPSSLNVLYGTVMELEDCAFPLLHKIIPTADLAVAFKDVSAAFLVAAMPRKQGMERKDLLLANKNIFKMEGEALNTYAKKDVKVLVIANPANTNALICSKYAPSIPKANFTALTRLDQNRAQAQIALKLNVSVGNVSNLIIWGNHSSTQFPDAAEAIITENGSKQKAAHLINNDSWLRKDFVEIIEKRGATVINARKMSSAMSAAKAAADHMRDWFFGTQPGKFVSMGVISDGSYDAPKDVIFSFPVTIKDGEWEIVKGLKLDDFAKKMLETTGKELLEERQKAFLAIES